MAATDRVVTVGHLAELTARGPIELSRIASQLRVSTGSARGKEQVEYLLE